MARRKPKQRPPKLKAPESDYTGPDGELLTLRGALTPATRVKYAQALAGTEASAAATREDLAQRAAELLFEHLAVRWEIAGTPPIERQRELLARYRAASTSERAWVRDALRGHCAEYFPDVQVP